MNDATKMTFRYTQRSRGCAEFGPSELTYTETVHADGTVEASVRGTCDGEYVNVSKVRPSERTFNLAVVRAAREASGWTVVS